MNGRCCIFQPFDKGAFDKRCRDTLEPAIRAADLEPYRVDKDDSAVILIEALHEEIRSSSVCLADITTRNPNVMYELGFAIASGKEVVIICAEQSAEKFPFDLQHRRIITYPLESQSDFVTLGAEITKKLKALVLKQETLSDIAAASPVKSTEGLQPSEVATLATVMANFDPTEGGVPFHVVRSDMEKIGYRPLATNLALRRLAQKQFISFISGQTFSGEPYVAYSVLEAGEKWLFDNQHLLELRMDPAEAKTRAIGLTEGEIDIPF